MKAIDDIDGPPMLRGPDWAVAIAPAVLGFNDRGDGCPFGRCHRTRVQHGDMDCGEIDEIEAEIARCAAPSRLARRTQRVWSLVRQEIREVCGV